MGPHYRSLSSFALIFACVAIFLGPRLVCAQNHPNILFVLTDDVGLGDIESYNANSQLRLPTIESLAAEGMRFTDAHTSAALCAPSRYSIITGNYQWRGLREWGQWKFKGGSQILSGQQTLGNLLQQAGYVTAFIGKHHMGADFYVKNTNGFATANTPETDVDFARQMRSGPRETGFDYSFVAMRGNQGSPYAFFENDRLDGNAGNLINWIEGDYGDTRIVRSGIGLPSWNTREVGPMLVEKAVDFIGAHHQDNIAAGTTTPFFLYFNSEAVHEPRKPPDALFGTPIRGTSGLGPRGDMLREIDEALRIIQSELADRGLLDNTLIILTSDNGAARINSETSQGHDATGALRGDKGTIFEGGHRVPLIIKWGDGSVAGSRVAPNSVGDMLIGIQDMYATIAALVNVGIPEDQARDSFNMLPIILGQSNNALRDHLILAANDDDVEGNAPIIYSFRDAEWKLILDSKDKPTQLYNLKNDLKEANNLINQAGQSAQVSQMLGRYNALRASDRSAPLIAEPSLIIASPLNGASVPQGDSIRFSATATDPEDGDLSATIVWTSSLDGALGVGSTVASTSLSVGKHTIVAKATNSGGLTGSVQIVLTVDPLPNRAPIASSIPNGFAMAGRFFSQNLATSFSDPDNGKLIFTSTGLPNSFSLNVDTGVVSGTPNAVDVSSSPILAVITATDTSNAAAQANYSIVVSSASAPPPPQQTSSGGGGLSLQFVLFLALTIWLRHLVRVRATNSVPAIGTNARHRSVVVSACCRSTEAVKMAFFSIDCQRPG